MPYCTACGHHLPEEAHFCPACGGKAFVEVAPTLAPPISDLSAHADPAPTPPAPDVHDIPVAAVHDAPAADAAPELSAHDLPPSEPAAPDAQPSEPYSAAPEPPIAAASQAEPAAAPAPVVEPEPELPDHLAGAIAYITFIPAVVLLVMEPFRRRPFVRFHCIQSILLSLLWMIGGWLFGHIAGISALHFIGHLLVELWNLALICATIFCALQALMKRAWRLPMLGDHAARFADQ